MKCQNCGAEVKSGKFCEYCGCELPKDNPNVNITNNYYGNVNNSTEDNDTGKCPKCNCATVKFQREKIGSVGSSQSSKMVFGDDRRVSSVEQTAYRTVGICQNCGYTWDPNEVVVTTSNTPQKSKGKGCLWWFLAICFWPIALSVWFYKTDKVKLEKKWRAIIIAAVWIFMWISAALSPSETQSETPSTYIENTEEIAETIDE